MSWKNTALIGASTIVLVVGVNQALQPRTPAEFDKQRNQQQVEELSDADEQSKERIRRSGEEGLKSENQRKLVPTVPSPPVKPPRPRIRLRLRLP